MEHMSTLEDRMTELEKILATASETGSSAAAQDSNPAGTVTGAVKPAAAPHVSVMQALFNRYGTTAVRWRQIALGVGLAASVSYLSWVATQFIDLLLPAQMHENGILWSSYYTARTFLNAADVFGPVIFGIWVAFKWPGRHPIGYLILGFLVGALYWVLGLVTSWLFYALGLSEIGVSVDDTAWVGSLITFLSFPAAVFLAGGLVGDLIKRRVSPQTLQQPSFVEKAAGAMLPAGREPSERQRRLVSTLNIFAPILAYVVGPTIVSLILYLLTGQLPDTSISFGGPSK